MLRLSHGCISNKAVPYLKHLLYDIVPLIFLGSDIQFG